MCGNAFAGWGGGEQKRGDSISILFNRKMTLSIFFALSVVFVVVPPALLLLPQLRLRLRLFVVAFNFCSPSLCFLHLTSDFVMPAAHGREGGQVEVEAEQGA